MRTYEEINMAESIVLMTQGLTKSYGNVRALRGVDLEVQQPVEFKTLSEEQLDRAAN
jgi:ABC-type sugar transport system ATPase subunit